MAAGSGLTATADASITRTIIGVTTSAYASPTTNGLYVALYNQQFSSASKSAPPAVEWTTSSDGTYARQQIGVSPINTTAVNWTIAAYVSSVGVVWTNTNQISFPAVSLNSQTLNAVGFVDTVGPTGGNINVFADLQTPTPVNIGIQVIFAATSPGPAGIQFTTY